MVGTLRLARLRNLFTSRTRSALEALTPAQHAFFRAEGYLHLPAFFTGDEMGGLKDALDRLWADRAERKGVAIDVQLGLPDAARIWFSKARDEDRTAPYRLLDLHLNEREIQDVAAGLRLIRVVKDLLGTNPIIGNSQLSEWGVQQDAHFDTFLKPSTMPGMMVAAWVAIDPVTADNGSLYCYPRSHLIEPPDVFDDRTNATMPGSKTFVGAQIARAIEKKKLKKAVFRPNPGDVFIRHARLLHGVDPITDPTGQRRALVTQYWTEGDFPDPEMRRELEGGRWLLRRPNFAVTADEMLDLIDSFLATLDVPEDTKAAAPDGFDPRLYLAGNQDVLMARANPWSHYAAHGQKEGRRW